MALSNLIVNEILQSVSERSRLLWWKFNIFFRFHFYSSLIFLFCLNLCWKGFWGCFYGFGFIYCCEVVGGNEKKNVHMIYSKSFFIKCKINMKTFWDLMMSWSSFVLLFIFIYFLKLKTTWQSDDNINGREGTTLTLDV